MRVIFTAHGLERLHERSTLHVADAIEECKVRLAGSHFEVWFDDGLRNVCVNLSDGCWAVLRDGYKNNEHAVVTVLTWQQFRFNRNRWWSKSASGSTPATSNGFWKPFADAFKEAK